MSKITSQYKNDVFKKMGINFEKGKKLLDVGCGDCVDDRIFIQRYKLKVFGIDVYEHENVKKTKGLGFKKGSIYKIPYKNDEFDYIFLHDVLHHIDEKNQSLKLHMAGLSELKRVCKKEGKIIILEANRFNPLFYPHMVLMNHHNHFKQSYFKKIICSKFKKVEFKYFEAHAYPVSVKNVFKVYEWLMEKIPFLSSFRSYNLAIINKA